MHLSGKLALAILLIFMIKISFTDRFDDQVTDNNIKYSSRAR